MKHAGIAVPKLDMESVSQAPEKPPMPLCEYELAGKKMDELFVQWLARGETALLVGDLIEALRAGRPIETPPLPPSLAAVFGAPVSAASDQQRPASPPGGGSGVAVAHEGSPGRRPRSPGVLGGGPPRSPTARSPRQTPPLSPSQQDKTSPVVGNLFPESLFSPPQPSSPAALAAADVSDSGSGSESAHSPGGVAPSSVGVLAPELPATPSFPHSSEATEADGDCKHNSSDNSVTSSSSSASKSAAARDNHLQQQQSSSSSSLSLGPRLPLFYVAGAGGRGRGRRPVNNSLEARKGDIESVWRGRPSLRAVEFEECVRDLLGLPGILTRTVMQRINLLCGGGNGDGSSREGQPPQEGGGEGELRVSLEAFLKFWPLEVEPFDEDERFFRLIKQPASSTFVRDDLAPLVNELVATHPGLQFLQSAEEFQDKYALTVATRIMYTVNTSRTGLVSSRECRKGQLLQAWRECDAQDDINRATRFFSYEHFYVLYCRFWELDHDHDGCIGREELLRYGGHRLSHAIVDRIFAVGHRIGHLASSPSGLTVAPGGGGARLLDRSTMRYDDFVYFMLSEEDKATSASLRYWFECVDLDADGAVTPRDMRHFYDTQSARMESLGHEVVPFDDVLCQMTDMIKPQATNGRLVLSDLLKPQAMASAGVVFDALFNLDKFISFEQRDPFAERHKRDDPFDCEWDRFAFAEYNRLAAEEEAREQEMDLDPHGNGGSMGVEDWGDSM